MPLTGSRAGTETVEANLKVGERTHASNALTCTFSENHSQAKCLFQEGLDEWAQQIHTAVCLIDGKMLPKELELNAGQVLESNIALILL